MFKSTVLQILRTFTSKELNTFGDFVNSPYFNKNKNVINLLSEIRKWAPEFTDAHLEKEKLWIKIFPEQKFNYGIMKNLIFDLGRLCDQYIVSTKFENDEPSHSSYLLQGLLDRYLKDYYHKKLESSEKKFNMTYFVNKNYSSSEYFSFRVNLAKFHQLYFQHFERDHEMISIINAKTFDLVAGFFTEIFKTYNDALAFASNAGDNDTTGRTLIEKILHNDSVLILESLKELPGEGHGVIRIYRLMFECFRNKGGNGSYQNLKEAVLKSVRELSDSEMRNLHMCLINCYVLYPQPGTDNNKELVEIFDSMIEKSIIKAPGEKWIEEHIFSYYIIHCSNLGRPDKIRSFIEKYQNSVNPEVLGNLRVEINCLLNFLEKNYEEALKHLNELQFNFFGKKLLSRSMKVKLLYEMDQYEAFIYERDAYNHFLKNNESQINMPGMSQNRIAKIRMQMDIMNKLFLLRSDFKEEKFYELHEQIIEHVGTENWYSEKMNELSEANGIKPSGKKILSRHRKNS